MEHMVCHMNHTATEWIRLATLLSQRIPPGNRRDCSRQTGIPSATLTRKLNAQGAPFRADELAALANYLGTTTSALYAELDNQAA